MHVEYGPQTTVRPSCMDGASYIGYGMDDTLLNLLTTVQGVSCI